MDLEFGANIWGLIWDPNLQSWKDTEQKGENPEPNVMFVAVDYLCKALKSSGNGHRQKGCQPGYLGDIPILHNWDRFGSPRLPCWVEGYRGRE